MIALAMAPVYRHGMTIERCEWHLWNWEAFMLAGGSNGGYLSRASVGASTNSREFDAMVAEVDRRCAEAVDAIIEDLPVAMHIAVYVTHRLCRPVFTLRSTIPQLYNEAKPIIAKGLTAKGIE